VKRPDMARGTRSTALALNTSAKEARYREVATALGPRWLVYVKSVNGHRKDVASCRTPGAAEIATDHLNEAIQRLHLAARVIAFDREMP